MGAHINRSPAGVGVFSNWGDGRKALSELDSRTGIFFPGRVVVESCGEREFCEICRAVGCVGRTAAPCVRLGARMVAR